MTEDRFFVDLDLPEGDEDLAMSSSGDLLTVSGRDNLARALRRRAVTAPRTITHRPSYGGGLPLFVEALDSAPNRSELANRLRESLFEDPRVGEATVRVASGAPGAPFRPNAVTVELAVRARSDEEAFRIVVALET